ncbi:MAG: type I-U CRISPR-associated protein Cas7 [Planctomycetota bacterium]|nr:MAG: type I-U CRISPR-associated protein Cas7 [Planctomycetota bacterium]
MSLNFEDLKQAPRILIEAPLKPLAGTRIQPTGFPDLGAAEYIAPPTTEEEKKAFPNGVPTLLVESAQSMANRLEAVCWDEATENVVTELNGLPYVRVKLAGPLEGTDSTTTSLQEFHRLNSPYIMSGLQGDKPFDMVLKQELKLSGVKSEGDDKEAGDVAGVVNLRRLAQVCFKYDPNSLVHGIFLEKIAGRLRHPRALSSFIEASGVGRADSGGVKFDRALPKPSVANVDAAGGYGNVPFHRTEFTAKSITAYFSLDLAQIRGYGLGDDATQLLISLSLWKVRKFLESSMRLRSACELELVDNEGQVTAKRPSTFVLPSTDELTNTVSTLLKKCRQQFADPLVTELTWTGGKKPKADKTAGKKGVKKDEE